MKNDYYVYLHKTLDGDIFYVGKGRKNRAWVKFSRSKAWNEVSGKGYSVELYSENLFEKEALEIESRLIETLPNLVNTRILNTIKCGDYSEYFEYDPESPSGLIRVKGVVSGRGRGFEQGKLGPCGNKLTRACGKQQWVIGFKGRFTQIHRIIWQLIKGEIPDGFVVDHIDGDSLNNNISNLRIITQDKNSRNARKRKDNSSGVAGVRLHTDKRSSCTYWRSRFHDLDGKHICKYFSIERLGDQEAYRLACEWRAEQILLLNAQGAGYTERHGT